MGSLLQSTKNTRVLPTGTMRYIRSDAPENLTDKEIQWLLDNNITTIIDLRSDEELARKPCCLKEQDGFRYFHLPVTGGGDTPKSLEHLHTVYQQMIDAKMEEIIDTIMNAESKVMYFCTAGKDRTGVVSAIILRRLGISYKSRLCKPGILSIARYAFVSELAHSKKYPRQFTVNEFSLPPNQTAPDRFAESVHEISLHQSHSPLLPRMLRGAGGTLNIPHSILSNCPALQESGP